MTRRTKVILAALCLPAALALGLAIRWTRPWESPGQRAVRICRECGLSVPDIEGLIKTMRSSPGSREEKLRALCATFPDRADAEPCVPCSEAVLDATCR